MIKTLEKDPFIIVEMPESIDLYNASELKKHLYPLAEEKEYIAVDFSNVRVIDSSGLGVLAVLSKKMRGENKVFALFSIQDNIYQVMKITSADRYFDIYDKFEDIERS